MEKELAYQIAHAELTKGQVRLAEIGRAHV